MMVIGTLAWLLIGGVYSGLVIAAIVYAIGVTLRTRGRTALACWGLVAWLVAAPMVLILLYVPIHAHLSLGGGDAFPIEKPRILDGLLAATLIAYAITAPLFLIPLIRARHPSPRSVPQAA